MSRFVLVLAALWMALSGRFSLDSLLVGGVLGFAILTALGRLDLDLRDPLGIAWRNVPAFVLFYLGELLLANFRIAAEVLRPRLRLRPILLDLPLDPRINSEARITLLANLITLTPGTLTVVASLESSSLLVHFMASPAAQPEQLVNDLKANFERRVLEILC